MTLEEKFEALMNNDEHLEKKKEYLRKQLGESSPSRIKREFCNLKQQVPQVNLMENPKARRTLLAPSVRMIMSQGPEGIGGIISSLAMISK